MRERLHSILANTPPCHGGKTGSIPVGVAKGRTQEHCGDVLRRIPVRCSGLYLRLQRPSKINHLQSGCRLRLKPTLHYADVVELVYTIVLETIAFGRVGSNPSICTSLIQRNGKWHTQV